MDFKDLKKDHLYILEFKHFSNVDMNNDIWISKVLGFTEDGKVEFEDILSITGDVIDEYYRYSEKTFNEQILIHKEISYDTHPEYFI